MERFGGVLSCRRKTDFAYSPRPRDRVGTAGSSLKTSSASSTFGRPHEPGWRVGRFGWVKPLARVMTMKQHAMAELCRSDTFVPSPPESI
jgi:hypothetical protein